jgi:hypothetical protein
LIGATTSDIGRRMRKMDERSGTAYPSKDYLKYRDWSVTDTVTTVGKLSCMKSIDHTSLMPVGTVNGSGACLTNRLRGLIRGFSSSSR